WDHLRSLSRRTGGASADGPGAVRDYLRNAAACAAGVAGRGAGGRAANDIERIPTADFVCGEYLSNDRRRRRKETPTRVSSQRSKVRRKLVRVSLRRLLRN